MRLFQLIYVSRAFGGVSDQMLADIQRAAHRRNPHLGITGVLFSSRGHFFQIVEGDPSVIAGLYSEIEQDSRHSDVRTVYFGPAERRCFPDWTMGVFDLDAAAQETSAEALWRFLNERDSVAPGVCRDNLITLCETFKSSLGRAA